LVRGHLRSLAFNNWCAIVVFGNYILLHLISI